jgi:hypothetical protein
MLLSVLEMNDSIKGILANNCDDLGLRIWSFELLNRMICTWCFNKTKLCHSYFAMQAYKKFEDSNKITFA